MLSINKNISLDTPLFKLKSAFEHAQHAQIQIILHMRKVQSNLY